MDPLRENPNDVQDQYYPNPIEFYAREKKRFILGNREKNEIFLQRKHDVWKENVQEL